MHWLTDQKGNCPGGKCLEGNVGGGYSGEMSVYPNSPTHGSFLTMGFNLNYTIILFVCINIIVNALFYCC